MGQHQVQRQLLQNFSFPGRQPNSRETWRLSVDSHRPSSRSVRRVGFFEVECSEEVDGYITACEDNFKDLLHRFSSATFKKDDVGRSLYDFIAMHYVRSEACRRQLEHMLDECVRQSRITQEQADLERVRLTSYQDRDIFEDLVDSVARVLTHYVVCPVIIDDSWKFLTSDKIMSAVTVPGQSRKTAVWFPIGPSTGLYLDSEGYGGQILGPTGIDRKSGRIIFVKPQEAEWLRFQAPDPQEGTQEFVTALNVLMVEKSADLYAGDSDTIDSGLQNAQQPTGYRYLPS